MEEGILSLRWNNHRSTFFHVLSTLHRKELYSDVTIACSGKFFPVHKFVLSVCSEYFEDIFKQTTCKHPIVVLKDILHDDMEALLNYMYAGEANVAQSDLARLIKAAECLKIRGLAVPDEVPTVSESKRSLSEGRSKDEPSSKRKREEAFSPSSNKSNHNYIRDADNQDSISCSRETSSNSDRSRDNKVEDSSQERHNVTSSNNEVVIDDHSIIKEELNDPKHEQDDDISHLTDSDTSVTYNPVNSIDERQGVGVGMFEPQILPSSHSQNVIQDIMVQGVAGPSSVSTESLPGWDSGGNIPGFSLENFSADDTRSLDVRGNFRQDSFGNSCGNGSSGGVACTRGAANDGGMHPCFMCPKRFTSRQDLKRHIRTHTGERPYQCPLCRHRAALKGNIKKHILSVHKDVTPTALEAAAVLDIEAFECSDNNLNLSGFEPLQNCSLPSETFSNQ